MITPTQAVEILTKEPTRAQDTLFKSLPEQDVRELLRVAVRLLWGEDVA